MVRSVTAGLGALTVLAVAGALTPPGQEVLGLSAASPAAPVTVIADAPGPAVAGVAGQARVLPALSTTGRAAAVRAPRVSPRPAPVPRPAAPAQASPTPGLGQVVDILLSLPQVLSQAGSEQGQVRPAPDRPVPRVWQDRWVRGYHAGEKRLRADDRQADNR